MTRDEEWPADERGHRPAMRTNAGILAREKRGVKMQKQEWTFEEHAGLPPGPWKDEPDKVQWQDETTGLPCLIVRQLTSGHLCGYVGVMPEHPWHGIGYSGCTQKPVCGEDYCTHYPDVDVHGGLTFADKCHPREGGRGVCHVPEPGESEDVWWFGFDCAHSGDKSHFFGEVGAMRISSFDGVYRDISYVQYECRRLARRLQEVASWKS